MVDLLTANGYFAWFQKKNKTPSGMVATPTSPIPPERRPRKFLKGTVARTLIEFAELRINDTNAPQPASLMPLISKLLFCFHKNIAWL